MSGVERAAARIWPLRVSANRVAEPGLTPGRTTTQQEAAMHAQFRAKPLDVQSLL